MLEIEKKNKTCFVVMPFSKEMKPIYDRIYEPVIRDCQLEPVRIDTIFKAGLITKDIFDAIQVAELIIADLTEANPNVYYELGIAHREKKPVILTCQDIDNDVRFDVKSLRCIEYAPGKDPFWNDQLREDLKKAIDETLAQPLSSVATPWLGPINEQKATPTEENLLQAQLNQIMDVVTSLHSQITREKSQSKFDKRYEFIKARRDELENEQVKIRAVLAELKNRNDALELELRKRDTIIYTLEQKYIQEEEKSIEAS